MKWHVPTPPTTNERGYEEHPAWGVISAHRVSSTPGAVLFDSEITHSEYIQVTIGRMARRRDLNQDWRRPLGEDLIQVDMSMAQWASFVSSMNTTGVSCTIRRTEEEINVPGLEFAPRLAVSAKEAREAAHKALARIEEAFEALDSLDPKAGVRARREAMQNLRAAIANAPSNVQFAADSLTRHTESVVAKARADIEAVVEAHARQIGIDPAEVRNPMALEQGDTDA